MTSDRSAILQDAPYLLEPLAASFASEEVAVRLALLAAAGKLFFQRPPECQKLLGTVLTAAAADSNIDIHDRALLYYRYFRVLLLRTIVWLVSCAEGCLLSASARA